MMLKIKSSWLKKTCFLVFGFLLSIFVSCNQDSIFADIAVEPAPVDPRIKGSPTNIVEYAGSYYVASIHSRTIHVYDGNKWDTMGGFQGRVAALAATNNGLYALTYSNDIKRTSLSRWNAGAWSLITLPADVYPQAIYGTAGRLYAGTDAAVYYVDGSGNSASLPGVNARLTGAAGSYISTDNGIYNNAGALVYAEGVNITGIIEANGNTYAVSWDGRIFRNPGTGFTVISTTSNRFTGALAEWIYDGRRLLLLGVQGSTNYDRGYREINLGDHGAVYSPGDWDGSTVSQGNKSRYEASLAKYSIHSMYQVNADGRIFASTNMDGLWSFKVRAGILGWNAED